MAPNNQSEDHEWLDKAQRNLGKRPFRDAEWGTPRFYFPSWLGSRRQHFPFLAAWASMAGTRQVASRDAHAPCRRCAWNNSPGVLLPALHLFTFLFPSASDPSLNPLASVGVRHSSMQTSKQQSTNPPTTTPALTRCLHQPLIRHSKATRCRIVKIVATASVTGSSTAGSGPDRHHRVP